MKRFFYILMLTFISVLSITACTEEEVAPSTELDNGGGVGADDHRPK